MFVVHRAGKEKGRPSRQHAGLALQTTTPSLPTVSRAPTSRPCPGYAGRDALAQPKPLPLERFRPAGFRRRTGLKATTVSGIQTSAPEGERRRRLIVQMWVEAMPTRGHEGCCRSRHPSCARAGRCCVVRSVALAPWASLIFKVSGHHLEPTETRSRPRAWRSCRLGIA